MALFSHNYYGLYHQDTSVLEISFLIYTAHFQSSRTRSRLFFSAVYSILSKLLELMITNWTFLLQFPFGKSVITVNCAKVTVANLRGCDGAVHILDRVLFPPNGDIIKVLTTAGNFTQFVTALRTTGLEHTLLGNGPVTVFAPTDAAFALLPPEDLQQLLSNSTLLYSVLQLHIFPREFVE